MESGEKERPNRIRHATDYAAKIGWSQDVMYVFVFAIIEPLRTVQFRNSELRRVFNSGVNWTSLQGWVEKRSSLST